MKNTPEKLIDRTGALQSGGVHGITAFAIFISMFFWVPYLWSQGILLCLLFIASSLAAMLAAGAMMEFHESDKPISIVLSLIIAVISIFITLSMTVILKKGILSESFGAGSAILLMHVPLFAGCTAVLIIGKIETRG